MATFQFPADFVFGVADADLQVIGEDACVLNEGAQPTMWSAFAAQGRTWNCDSPARGIDRYHQWKSDADLMTAFNVRNYRTSVSMSRLLTPSGAVNKAAVEWYRAYWSYLRSKGVRIYATLYHWELPQSLVEKGGWLSQETTSMFVKHATAVYEHLGDLIDQYFTLNEPWCSTMLSYHQGKHAPGHTSLTDALLAAHNILIASGLALRELLSRDASLKIGVVLNSEPQYAASTDPADQRAQQIADCYFNRWFYDPLFLGEYPKEILPIFEKHLPVLTKSDMETIRVGDKMYALGVNNYCGSIVKADPTRDIGYSSVKIPGGPENDLGWPVFEAPTYPAQLYDVLHQLYHSYRQHGLKRIYITENGMALRSNFDADGALLPDIRRVNYYRHHLQQVYDAKLAGVPVEGYFAWTLMDNYEWAEGYRPEGSFGLVHVDRDTLKRTPKESLRWFSQVIASGQAPY
jgi:beta-glucosidase